MVFTNVLQVHIYGTLHTPAALPETLCIEWIEILTGKTTSGSDRVVPQLATCRSINPGEGIRLPRENNPVATARGSEHECYCQ